MHFSLYRKVFRHTVSSAMCHALCLMYVSNTESIVNAFQGFLRVESCHIGTESKNQTQNVLVDRVTLLYIDLYSLMSVLSLAATNPYNRLLFKVKSN